MTLLTVFDPPQCCSSGVCGPSVDPVLANFAADLAWLQGKDVRVERLSLSLQPAAFAANPAVSAALRDSGNACLPILCVDQEVVSTGSYPDRRRLAALVGVPVPDASTPSSTTSCGPGCGCGSSGSRPGRSFVGVAVLFVAVGLLVMKAWAAPPAAAPSALQSPAFSASLPAGPATPATSPQTFGAVLDGLSSLDTAAANSSLVFIHMPDPAKPEVPAAVRAAAEEARTVLDRNGLVTLFFTLPPASADHGRLRTQVAPPAIVIARRGGGMTAVTGDVTKEKLLQAVAAIAFGGGCGSSGTSGCGPSGCGPAAPAPSGCAPGAACGPAGCQ